MDETVVRWMKEMERKGVEYAVVRTVEAVYDRVAVLWESRKAVVIEFPPRVRKGYRIVRETVLKRKIESFRYYTA